MEKTQKPEEPNRQSIRLKRYDYGQPGGYFVTLVAKGRNNIFGKIGTDQVMINKFGEIVTVCWFWLERQYPYVVLDAFIVMPNHLHGIIQITDLCRGGSRTAPTKCITIHRSPSLKGETHI